MLLELNKKKGFTLIEVLIVIAIVGLLSTLAVNGYIEYRKVALLDLAGDNLVSQIHEMQSLASYGETGNERFEEIKSNLEGGEAVASENSSKCLGIYFEKNADSFLTRSFSQKFVGNKVWSVGGWEYQGCGSFPANNQDIVFRNLELDEQVKVVSITYGQRQITSGLVLRFLPPSGDLEIQSDTDPFAPGEGFGLITIQIENGTTGLDKYKRNIIFDSKNKTATVTKVLQL